MKKTLGQIDRILCGICELYHTMIYIVDSKAGADWTHARNIADEISKEIDTLSRLWPQNRLGLEFYKASESACRLRDYIDDATDDDLDELVENLAELDSDFMNLVSGIGVSVSNIIESMAEYVPPVMPIGRSGPLAVCMTYDDIRRNPQAAVQQAFTLFEASLRERIGVGPDVYGETLINQAFGKDGSLTYGAVPAEQQGVRNLMAGAYAVFRNPRMHRITADDEYTALIIISLVEMLMQIVDEAKDG